MTRGNQRELARQKNMKKQSDSVKGKRQDDGLSAAAHGVSLCHPGWTAVAGSQLTASSASRVHAILRPQPPE
uniref:Small EDRK-rich factor 2 n=1 Tax=Theropithecus gelada TaxID=9565 RepID=A0A8D2EDB6_THEGE